MHSNQTVQSINDRMCLCPRRLQSGLSLVAGMDALVAEAKILQVGEELMKSINVRDKSGIVRMASFEDYHITHTLVGKPAFFKMYSADNGMWRWR